MNDDLADSASGENVNSPDAVERPGEDHSFPFALRLNHQSGQRLALNQRPGFFAMFRCRSIAAAGDLLFFVSPKKPTEKKGDPTVCVPPLRYGQPAVLAPVGVWHKLGFASDKCQP